MSDQPQPSTLKSYVDSATGQVQSTLGGLTGNTNKQAEGVQNQDKAQVEHDAANTDLKVPGATISGSGGIARDSPDRTQGSWNQTMGSAKETVGNLVGNESLKQTGRQQNLEGQQQEAKGQLSDFGSGMANRAQGVVGSTIAGATGDKTGQEHYEKMRADGKAQQHGAEHDIRKQAEVERDS